MNLQQRAMEILHKVYHASRPQIHILNMMELIWRMIENEWLKDWQAVGGEGGWVEIYFQAAFVSEWATVSYSDSADRHCPCLLGLSRPKCRKLVNPLLWNQSQCAFCRIFCELQRFGIKFHMIKWITVRLCKLLSHQSILPPIFD